MACFLTAFASIAMMRAGFSNLFETTELSDLAFAVMMVLMYAIILIFGWLLLQLALYAFGKLNDAARGKKPEDSMGGE
jgi:uncharacterized membrane protein (DUF106 family)